jgi:hypothetical protein
METKECNWCGCPDKLHSISVLDMTDQRQRREYLRYVCDRCHIIEERISERLERKYGTIYISMLNKKMWYALKKRGVEMLEQV